jgi:hypothetical protein
MLTTVLTLVRLAAPLVDAVKSGDKAAAIALIDKQADVNAPEADGRRPSIGPRIRMTSNLPSADSSRSEGEREERLRRHADVRAAIAASADMIEALLEAGATSSRPMPARRR